MEEIRARISFKTGLFLAMLGFLFVLGGGIAVVLAGFPEVTQALIALTLGDEVGRAFFLSGSIATVVIGSLLFYIGYDKIPQKQFMEILRRRRSSPSRTGSRRPTETGSEVQVTPVSPRTEKGFTYVRPVRELGAGNGPLSPLGSSCDQ